MHRFQISRVFGYPERGSRGERGSRLNLPLKITTYVEVTGRAGIPSDKPVHLFPVYRQHLRAES